MTACNTLSLFNTFTPKEGGIRHVANDVAFGDDPRQRYDVYAPKNATGDLPVVVYFYGGNWASGSKDDYVWMGHALASMGHVVVVPDYRLVPEHPYPDFVFDGAAAVKHAVTHAKDYGGDGSRLALMGQSAGGYIAALLPLDPQFLGDLPVKAVVGLAGPYDFYPFDVDASRNAFGHWPRPAETQPITHARKLGTHFLLMHSRADTVVMTKNAVNLDKALRDKGTPSTLKLYDGLSHQDMAAVFSIPFRSKGTVFADTRAFLASVL
nr:alpha/beta hydrolase [Asticcacaulis solisilvae]